MTSGHVRVITIDDTRYRLLFEDGRTADGQMNDVPHECKPLKVGDEIPWSLAPNGNLRIHFGQKKSA